MLSGRMVANCAEKRVSEGGTKLRLTRKLSVYGHVKLMLHAAAVKFTKTFMWM